MSSNDTKTIVLAVSGLRCAGCTGRVERTLSALDGVLSASVELAAAQATVVIDPGRISGAGLRQALAAAGHASREIGDDAHGSST